LVAVVGNDACANFGGNGEHEAIAAANPRTVVVLSRLVFRKGCDVLVELIPLALAARFFCGRGPR
jgi:hypothetical protein